MPTIYNIVVELEKKYPMRIIFIKQICLNIVYIVFVFIFVCARSGEIREMCFIDVYIVLERM